jgi:hypothetical protein
LARTQCRFAGRCADETTAGGGLDIGDLLGDVVCRLRLAAARPAAAGDGLRLAAAELVEQRVQALAGNAVGLRICELIDFSDDRRVASA